MWPLSSKYDLTFSPIRKMCWYWNVDKISLKIFLYKYSLVKVLYSKGMRNIHPGLLAASAKIKASKSVIPLVKHHWCHGAEDCINRQFSIRSCEYITNRWDTIISLYSCYPIMVNYNVWKLIMGGGVQMLNAMAEIYSTVRKGTKENQECPNGDF